MSSFAYRFVGCAALPSPLSDFDVEQFFCLGAAGVHAVEQRFRSDRRLAGALQLLILRAAVRPLERSGAAAQSAAGCVPDPGRPTRHHRQPALAGGASSHRAPVLGANLPRPRSWALPRRARSCECWPCMPQRPPIRMKFARGPRASALEVVRPTRNGCALRNQWSGRRERWLPDDPCRQRP
jgi:hypothetical protein